MINFQLRKKSKILELIFLILIAFVTNESRLVSEAFAESNNSRSRRDSPQRNLSARVKPGLLSLGADLGTKITQGTEIGIGANVQTHIVDSSGLWGLSLKQNFFGSSFFVQGLAGPGWASEYREGNQPSFLGSIGNEWELESGLLLGFDWASCLVVKNSEERKGFDFVYDYPRFRVGVTL